MGGKRETGRCHAGNGWVPCRPNGEGGYHAACNAECGCPAAQDGKVLRCQERKVPRCREEVLRCPERGSCRSHPGKQLRNRYCQIAVLPNLLFAKSTCRIAKSAILPGLSETWSSRFWLSLKNPPPPRRGHSRCRREPFSQNIRHTGMPCKCLRARQLRQIPSILAHRYRSHTLHAAQWGPGVEGVCPKPGARSQNHEAQTSKHNPRTSKCTLNFKAIRALLRDKSEKSLYLSGGRPILRPVCYR